MSTPVHRHRAVSESTHDNYVLTETRVSNAADTLDYLYRHSTPPQAVVALEITHVVNQLRQISPSLELIGRLVAAADYSRHVVNLAVVEANALLRALKPILDAIFDAVGDTYKYTFASVWRQLGARILRENDQALNSCLTFFQTYLQHLEQVLTGVRPDVSLVFGTRLEDLLQAQKLNIQQSSRQATAAAQPSGSTRGASGSGQPSGLGITQDSPRVYRQQGPSTSAASPASPTSSFRRVSSPQPSPLSSTPPFPAASSPTRPTPPQPASTTMPSYARNRASTNPTPTIAVSPPIDETSDDGHWAWRFPADQETMERLRTPYPDKFKSQLPPKCHGKPKSDAQRDLEENMHEHVNQIYFDPQGNFRVRFYWRPRDNQAHILITQASDDGRTIDWSAALLDLKIVRQNSSLLLGRPDREPDNNLVLNVWARLNFNFHERMVLFYSTFVAMKHQDSREVSPEYVDDIALQKTAPEGEVVEFKADLLYNNVRLEFRVWRDVPSNTFRYEVTRPQHSIPLWTAFVTRYVGDSDIMCIENKTEVHIDALKPPPYVFGEFEFLRNQNKGYILPFTNETDAKKFLNEWVRLCRSKHATS